MNKPRRIPAVWALAVGALVLFGAGCKKRTVQAAPPVMVSQPAPAPEPEPAKPEPTPKPVEPVNPAPAPVTPTTKPSSPRTTAPRPATPEPAPEPAAPKPAAPQITPRMSAAQRAEHEQKTKEAINVTERNLQKAYGRKLNPAQLDMVEKIRAFLAQSREASAANDWVRALNLAQKAQVLSDELVRSL